MSSVNVCLSFDDNYAKFGCTVMNSILINTNSTVNFYILHDGLEKKTIEKLNGFSSSFDKCVVNYVDVSEFFENIELSYHSIAKRMR